MWTRDPGRGLRFAEAVRTGWVNVNATTNHWESHLPFGGRVGGRHPMKTFTGLKIAVVSLT